MFGYDELLRRQEKEREDFINKRVSSLISDREFIESSLYNAIISQLTEDGIPYSEKAIKSLLEGISSKKVSTGVTSDDTFLLPLSSANKQFQKKEFYGVIVDNDVVVNSDVKKPFKHIVRALFDYLIKYKGLDLASLIDGSDLAYNGDLIIYNSVAEYEKRKKELKAEKSNSKRRLDVIYTSTNKDIIIAAPYEISNEKEAKLVKDILVMFLPSLDNVAFICKAI